MLEVAHDMHAQVSSYMYVTRIGLHNSYDTWHGKSIMLKVLIYRNQDVSKEMKKVTEG